MATRFVPSPSILNFMASSPNYGKLGSVGATENLKTAAQDLISNSEIHGAGMTGRVNRGKAKYEAQSVRAEAGAQGHSLVMGGLSQGIQSFAGGLGSRLGSSGAPSYGGTGTGTIDKASVANSIASVNGREASAFLSSGNSFPSFLDSSAMPTFSGPSYFGN